MIIVGIFLVAFLKSAFFSNFGFGLLDQGQMLHNGQRILAGELPYRDFFAVFPPMYNYIFALIFKFFGQSIFISRVMLSIIFSFVPVFVYLITSVISNKRWAILPSLLIIIMDNNVERIYFFTPILVAIYFYMKWFKVKSIKLIFLSGLWLGIASLFRLDIPGVFGLGIIISMAMFLKNTQKKWLKVWFLNSLNFGLAYLIPIVLELMWLTSKGIVPNFIDNAAIQPIFITRFHHLPFPSLFSIFPINISPIWLNQLYLVTYANLLMAIYFLSGAILIYKWKFFWQKRPWFGFFLTSGLLAFPYILGRTDIGHLTKGGIPFLFLSVYFLEKVNNSRKLFLKLLGLTLVLAFFIANLVQSVWWIKFNDRELLVNRNKLRVNSVYPVGSTIPSAQTLEKSIEFLQKNSRKEEKVLILPYMAGLYFLAGRQSPTRFDNVLNGYITTIQGQEEFIEQIQKAGVKAVIYDMHHGPKMKTSLLKDYNPLIHNYLMNNYEIYGMTPEGWLFMLRKGA